MPSKKKRYNARFPPARIKKIMQTDDEVGKVAAAVPVIISRALELFVESLVKRTSEITKSRNAKTLTPSHIKSCILGEAQFQFLKDLVASIPDVQPEDDGQYPNSSASDVPRTPTRLPRQQRKRRRRNNDENSASGGGGGGGGNRESTADETETGSEGEEEEDEESEGASSENTSDKRLGLNSSHLPQVSQMPATAQAVTPNFYLPQNFHAATTFSQSPTFSGLSCSTATATSTEDDDYDS